MSERRPASDLPGASGGVPEGANDGLWQVQAACPHHAKPKDGRRASTVHGCASADRRKAGARTPRPLGAWTPEPGAGLVRGVPPNASTVES